jgi:hypothetical protein
MRFSEISIVDQEESERRLSDKSIKIILDSIESNQVGRRSEVEEESSL